MSGGKLFLYGYGIVCICMLIFNTIYIFVQKGYNTRLEKHSRKYADGLLRQLEQICGRGTAEAKYVCWLQKKLLHVNNLIAFEQALNSPQVKQDETALASFLHQTQFMIRELAEAYKDREDLQAAYFAYFLSRHKTAKYIPEAAIQDIMVEYMRKNNLYCRVNAMLALYTFGTPENVAKAIEIMSRMDSSFNGKLLTDGLLSYSGDHSLLIKELLSRFDRLSDRFRLPVMNLSGFNPGSTVREYMPSWWTKATAGNCGCPASGISGNISMNRHGRRCWHF